MPRQPTRIISIASGKGGVGKTNVALNLAWALGAVGRRVCILDADLGLSNVDIMLGVSPEKTLEDVLFAGLPLERAVLQVGRNVSLVSGGSGVARLAELAGDRRVSLMGELAKLTAFDCIIVDNSPGITAQIISLSLSASDVLLICNPEAASLTDTYALLKVLRENGLTRPPSLIVNRVRSAPHAKAVFEKLSGASRKYLGLGCSYLGAIPEDRAFEKAAALRRPLVEISPRSTASKVFFRLAWILDREISQSAGEGASAEEFFARSLERMADGPHIPLQRPQPPQATPAQRPAATLPAVGGQAVQGASTAQVPNPLLIAGYLEKIETMVGNLSAMDESERRALAVRKIQKAVYLMRQRLDPDAKPIETKRRVVAAPAPTKPSLPLRSKAFVVGKSSFVRDALASIAESMGLDPLSVNPLRDGEPLSVPGVRVALVSYDRSPKEIEEILNVLHGMPVVLLEDSLGKGSIPEPHRRRAAAIVERPMRMEAIRAAIAPYSDRVPGRAAV